MSILASPPASGDDEPSFVVPNRHSPPSRGLPAEAASGSTPRRSANANIRQGRLGTCHVSPEPLSQAAGQATKCANPYLLVRDVHLAPDTGDRCLVLS
jgi:hypothetical protein